MIAESCPTKRSMLFLSLSLVLGLGLLTGLLWMTGAARADSSVLHVTPDGPTSGTCASWAAPCDLQFALDLADPGDEIWVAQGLYTPTHPTMPREGTFSLQEGVAVYGGFEGDETNHDERDWETYITVLSGDTTGNDITDANGVVTNTANVVITNVYHVVTALGVTETAKLDGFVITAGFADDSRWGGGLYCYDASPTLRNLTFRGNSATNGGGMANREEGWPTLTNVAFLDNWAYARGGGLYNYEASATLNDVTFRRNQAREGGGMANQETPWLAISGASFVRNEAVSGSGTPAGGGMHNSHSNSGSATAISITDVIFVRNTSEATGGGMANRMGVTPTLVNVGFYGNVALAGGGAGMHSNNASSPKLYNVVFVGNSAEKNGGAMHHQGACYPILVNVTMISNEARNGPGGGIFNQGSFPVISNTLIGDNQATAGDQINNTANCSPTIAYSSIEGAFNPAWDLSLGVDGGGNMSAYPGFISNPDAGGDGKWGTDDDDYGNLRLGPLSPVRDKGDNASVPPDVLDVDGDADTNEQLPYDFDDNPRITGGVVDMGAYEIFVRLDIIKKVAGAGTGPQDAVELAQGDPLTYTLRFRNSGTQSTTGVILTDVIPASVVDTEVISFGLPITPLAGTSYVWEVGPMRPNSSGVLTITGLLSGCVPASHQVVNTATIWSADMANPDNNTATATITATNRAPLAVDDAYTVTARTVLTLAAPGVLNNDSDPDCDELWSQVLAPPLSGTLDLALDGSLVYTPVTGFSGVVTFAYQASDGDLAGQALVTLTVEKASYQVFLPAVLKEK